MEEGTRTGRRQLGAGIGICKRQQEVGTRIDRLMDVRTCNKRTSLKKVKQLRRV